MTQLALSAIGRDRPGIVAEVTRALLGHSLNITDSQMAVLGGRFAMMLIVDAPEGTDLDAVREELATTRSRLDLDAVALHPLAGTAEGATGAPSHIVTVYGVDHPGIVHAVSARLAARSVNVTDLETRLVGEGLYAMVLEISIPPELDPDALTAMLTEVGDEQGVEVTVRPLEADVMQRAHVVREVLRYPHPALKQAALPIHDASEIARVGEDLVDTMDSFGHCVGLAATQLGELVRMIVVDVSGHRKARTCNGRLLLVNPRIASAEGAEIGREGCLSIPELTANVRRATSIVVEAQGATVHAEGFEARCLQHEIDHLDGLLFLDRVDSLTADVFRRVRTA